ncbi:AAA family ATPase [Micromonospora taraxaci]|uniref:AAA family ATPase n=1 Tax=Micromonospora taraxaci TaxID=1316803 RepID=UPI003C2B3FA7
MGESVRADVTSAINQLLAEVDHSSKSNSKYRELEGYLAQLVQIDPVKVYAAYISKAGNATVRFDQSSRSRKASLLVGLLDPPFHENPSRTVDALVRYCALERPDAEVLLLLRDQTLERQESGFSNPSAKWYPHTHIRAEGAQTLLSLYEPWLDLQVATFVPQQRSSTAAQPLPRLPFYVVDSAKDIVPAHYPCVVLKRDRWDDLTYKTLFSCYLRTGPLEETEIGEVKILHRDQSSGPTKMPTGFFERLGQDYCSLGQSYSYYESLRQLPRDTYRKILRGLRDVVFDPRIRKAFETHPGFEISLLRTGGAARALDDAVPLFAGARETKAQRGMSFIFNTSVGGNRFKVDFAFNQSRKLPDRINAIIGYNGTGKTQLLANIALVATSDMRQRTSFRSHGEIENSKSVRFSKVIAISYSAFDTFVLPDAFWRQEEALLAQRRLEEKGEVFGYVYCGLRKRAEGQSQNTRDLRGLKGIDELTEEFAQALDLARTGENRATFLEALTIIGKEPSFGRTGLTPYSAATGEEWRQHFRLLSTGHKIVLNIIVQVAGHSEPGSLILVDEPESHLHPSLLAALLRALNVVLRKGDSYAIIATHSPVVLQEIPRRYVRILQRYGDKTSVMEPLSETFGENVGYLTSNIFHLDSTQTDYHAVLENLAADMPLSEIEALFDYDMSAQARAYVLGLLDRARQ